MLNRTKILDYILVYLLVAFSGVPFFYRSRIEVLIICLLLPATVFVYRKKKIDKYIVYYITAAILVQAGQMLKFYYLPLTTFLGLHVRVLFAYLTLKAVGRRFVDYYVHILVFSVLISLVFYVFSYHSGFEFFLKNNIAPFFKHPFIKESNYNYFHNILVYTINTKGEGLVWLKRNSGPFWEPGAFSGFLILALILNIIRKGSLWNNSNRIIIVGLISAFSTTGFMALAYVIVSYYLINQSLVKRLFFVPLLLMAVVYLFVSVDFLGEKIERKMSFSGYTYNTRFKSAQIDLMDFAKSPFVGLGRSEKTRFDEEQDKRKIHRNNGVTNFLARYGVFIFSLYFITMLLGFRVYCGYRGFSKRFSYFALGAVWLIGFSEIYFTKVFFIALTMMPVLYSPALTQMEDEL